MRLERGLTQREVAEQMGIQRPAVSKMERKADMSISRFTEFVEALGGRWQILVSASRREDLRPDAAGRPTSLAGRRSHRRNWPVPLRGQVDDHLHVVPVVARDHPLAEDSNTADVRYPEVG